MRRGDNLGAGTTSARGRPALGRGRNPGPTGISSFCLLVRVFRWSYRAGVIQRRSAMEKDDLPELPKVELPAEYLEARALRNSEGRRRVAESGKLPNGRPPYGFWLVTKRDVMFGKRSVLDVGKLVEHEEHAGI